jgi:uncharacterized damage-inducible protein DinB
LLCRSVSLIYIKGFKMEETKQIASLLRRAFEKNAWYGPSLKEVLSGISADDATHRMGNSHSIIELVNHIISWKIFVIEKLKGNADYKVDDVSNFPRIDDWDYTLKNLDTVQAQLLAAISELNPERLQEKVPHEGYQYTFYALLHGIIHHDIYHIGQISLIKKHWR